MLAVFDLTEDQLPDDGQTLQWSCQAIRVFSRNRWCTLLGEKSKKNSVLHRSSHPISTLSTVIFWSNDLFVEMANSRSPSNFGVHMDHYESLLCRLPMFFMAFPFLCQCRCMDMPGRVQPHLYWSAECRGAAGGTIEVFEVQVETHQTGWQTLGKEDMVPRHHCVFLLSKLGGLRDSPGVTAGERKSAWPLGIYYMCIWWNTLWTFMRLHFQIVPNYKDRHIYATTS